MSRFENSNFNQIGNLSKRDIKSFGAKGDGVTDDTQAFVNAFSWANSLMYTGSGTNKYSGAEITISDGVYNLPSLSTPIDVKCNVKTQSAEVLIPSTYTTTVFNVGVTTAGDVLVGARIELPKVRNTSITSGSIAIKLNHLNTCKIYLDAITLFETGVYLTGVSQGVTYCEIHLGMFATCKRSLVLAPGASGWTNSNQFFSGSISQSPSYAGGVRVSGWRHIIMDGRSPATAIVGNTFLGISMEGNASEYLVEAYNAYGNTWYGTYHETGTSSISVTLNGDTFTSMNHGLNIGDYITFNASVTPTGMALSVGYYVTEVLDSNTFKVNLAKGVTPSITFSTNGSSLTYKLASRCIFDSAGGNCYDNTFKNLFMPPSILLDFIQVNQAYANGQNNNALPESKSAYLVEDVPLFRGRNTASSASSRPVFAAYGGAVNPVNDPQNWSTAIGDRGLIWANNRTELGRLFNSGNTMQYQTPNDSVSYEVASCRRSPSLINITNLSLTANANTFTDVTLTGASVYDHILVTPVQMLPSGVVYSHAFVTSANTIRVVFYNFTASAILLNAALQAVSFRRFY